jgi:hypothetical protein
MFFSSEVSIILKAHGDMRQDVLASVESQVHEMLVAWVLRELSLGQHSELVCGGIRRF